MKIHLAPMEGVLDHHLRNILTRIGGYDSCVTEFIRVVDGRIPLKVIKRIYPEFQQGGTTRAGTPVIVQLLGSDPQAMADNAQRLVQLGAPGIDINFGCPSKTVNKNDGGAILLREPRRLHDIVCAVRKAVPAGVPVSAKIRLGYDDTHLAIENAQAVEQAGADLLTVHARTRKDGYKAPARWQWLGQIRQAVTIRMVANGDINSIDDYLRCVEISGCEEIMLGRGAVMRPDLGRQIAHHVRGLQSSELPWHEVRVMLGSLASELQGHIKDRYILPRIKQWLVYLRQHYTEAQGCFDQVKPMRSYAEFEQLLHTPMASPA